MEKVDRLSASSNFVVWKARALPMLKAQATKLGVADLDLLPLALDDDLCIAYGNWRENAKSPDLDEALSFLRTWIIEFNGRAGAGSRFFDRTWKVGESLERYASELQNLGEACFIKPSDKAFKLRFVEGLPETIRPLVRLEMQGGTWPTTSTLMEKVRAMGVVPLEEPHATAAVRYVNAQSPPRRVDTCFNCGTPGHLVRNCPHYRQAGNGKSSWGRPNPR
jgi:hypothetical protein